MLMNSETIQSYVAMLKETQWVVVMGTKGTCKTSLVAGLAKHLALCVSGDDEAQVISFNVDKFGVEVSVCVCGGGGGGGVCVWKSNGTEWETGVWEWDIDAYFVA